MDTNEFGMSNLISAIDQWRDAIDATSNQNTTPNPTIDGGELPQYLNIHYKGICESLKNFAADSEKIRINQRRSNGVL